MMTFARPLAIVAVIASLTACGPTPPETAAAPETDTPPPAAAESFAGAFNALGNEPFWAVQVRDTSITLERPDDAPEVATYVRPDVEGTTARFKTVARSGHGLELTLVAQPCIDGMSGFRYAYAAKVRIGDETLIGCATRPEAPGPGDSQ